MAQSARRKSRTSLSPSLRRGWTTGACATAAAKAATQALWGPDFPDPVTITLPGGQTPAFSLARTLRGRGWAQASVIKDAGDDPDVTHGAEIVARVSPGGAGEGIRFAAGEGVGTVTLAGLPITPGEPAINPVPRAMIERAVTETAHVFDRAADVIVEISVPGGERMAGNTWNPRLGIVGGISILGTTGIVVPYSCASWIHSIHRGIDVARAAGIAHVAGATGNRSEAAVRARLGLPQLAVIDMGDFAGGMLKYLRTHPVDRVTVAGGFAKMAKLAQGALDLHSARSNVDFGALAAMAAQAGIDGKIGRRMEVATSAGQVLGLAGPRSGALAMVIAQRAAAVAASVVEPTPIHIDAMVVDRAGSILAEADGA